jgi:hypothetical protein
MGLHEPFGHLQHKLWQKERSEVKLPPKVGNQPNPGVCKWSATHRWKALDKGYNFSSDFIMIGGLHKKLCTLKVTRVPSVQISGLPLGQKAIRMWPPWRGAKYNIWGKVVASLESGPWWVISIVSLESHMAYPSTKGALESELTTLCLVKCICKWITRSLSLFLVPS